MYTDLEKLIYVSPLGTKHDPVEVCNRLTVASQGKFNQYVAVWYAEDSDDASRASAALELCAVARKAFGFKKLTEDGGVGDGSVLEVVDHFTGYMAKKGTPVART